MTTNDSSEFPAIPIDSQIINHLLVQKAVIFEDSAVGNERISDYLQMVKQLKTEEHLTLDNQMDRSVAIIFELVLENHIDPWNIDLAAFSKLFVGRMKDDPDMELIIIGEIIYMAFNILKLQSDYLVVHAEELSAPEEYEESFDYMDEFEDVWEAEEDNLFDQIVETSTTAPITERVRHKGARKVTLFELVEAFEGAFKEAKKHEEHTNEMKEAQKKRRQLSLKARKNVEKETHEENIKEDAKEVFRRILEMEKRKLTYNDIAGDDDIDRVRTFVSLLFLAFDRKINIWQVNFPYGDITIENIWKGDDKDDPVDAKLMAHEEAQKWGEKGPASKVEAEESEVTATDATASTESAAQTAAADGE